MIAEPYVLLTMICRPLIKLDGYSIMQLRVIASNFMFVVWRDTIVVYKNDDDEDDV